MDEVECAKRKQKEREQYFKRNKELSNDDNEASIRYEKYMTKDPFPNIEPALLNTADIFNYVAKTGMLYPFHTDKLAGASYEVAIKGKVIWWDKSTAEKQVVLLEKPGDSFTLEPNSIAFVTLEPMFRIPDYIALRFNLKIIHVYKGLLLGTGPLVDPGFVGRLSIPLHNLTSNTYTFEFEEDIIEMEFTKLSKNKIWENTNPDIYTEGLFKRKWIKSGRTIEEYISRALSDTGSVSVQSSIPVEIARIEEKAATTSKDVEKTSIEMKDLFQNFKADIEKKMNSGRYITLASVIAIITIVTTLFTFALTTIFQYSSVSRTNMQDLFKLQESCIQLENEYKAEINDLNNRITELEDKIKLMEADEEGGNSNKTD